jgi:hypothetical protein
MNLSADCKPFGIGSLPYTDGVVAWEKVLNYFPELPFWPQLPKRDYRENMYVQFSERFPGLNLDLSSQRISVDINPEVQQDIESFYNRFLSEDPSQFAVSRDYCEGIYSGLEFIKDHPGLFSNIEFIKGQITGPVSFGLQIIDQEQKPILYNDMFHDVVVKNIMRKAQWMVNVLKEFNENVIISVDEPYLSTLGSGFINLQHHQVIDDLESIFKSLTGLKAMHCCGNTDWSLITETSLDILLFDAYDYMKNLVLFSDNISEFLSSGGILGWGIVPTTSDELAKTNIQELLERLEDGFNALVQKGIDKTELLHNSLITPSCGLGNLSIDQAELAMEYTKQISEHLRKKYDL